MKIWGRTSETEKTQIKDKIAQYCAAISVRDWDLAKSYCYPESLVYSVTEQREALGISIPQSVTFHTGSINIKKDEATVAVNFRIQTNLQEEGEEYSSIKDCVMPAILILIKSEGEWYLYYLQIFGVQSVYEENRGDR